MASNKILERLDSIDKRLNQIETLFPSQKKTLTLDELVTYTGYTKSYIYKLTSTNQIPCSKPRGKKLFFEKEKVDLWLLQNRKKSKDEIDMAAATHIILSKK